MQQLTYQIFSTPIGEMLIAGTEYAITHVALGQDRAQLGADFLYRHEEASIMGKNGYVRQACHAIGRYLSGASARIDVAIQVGGTEFQRAVWQQLCQIPYGKTASYSEVAAALGSPDAFRAVANACADNPVPLIVPCHRVVHKSGEVSGFAWGPEAKHYLLDLEKKYASVLAAA